VHQLKARMSITRARTLSVSDRVNILHTSILSDTMPAISKRECLHHTLSVSDRGNILHTSTLSDTMPAISLHTTHVGRFTRTDCVSDSERLACEEAGKKRESARRLERWHHVPCEPNGEEVKVVGACGHVVARDVSGRHVGPDVVVPRAPVLPNRQISFGNEVGDPLFVPLVCRDDGAAVVCEKR
jgi:hypothetical protein